MSREVVAAEGWCIVTLPNGFALTRVHVYRRDAIAEVVALWNGDRARRSLPPMSWRQFRRGMDVRAVRAKVIVEPPA